MKPSSKVIEKHVLSFDRPFSVRSVVTDMVGHGHHVGFYRVAEIIDRLCLSGEVTRFDGPSNGPRYRVNHDVPRTPCSVVWYDGHPFVLDGEPGIPTERRWVGIGRSGLPITVSHEEMCKYRPAVIYTDRAEGVPTW